MESIGKLILSLGTVLIIVGLGLWLFADQLGWLGNLPGDIKIERPGFTLYFPVATMVLISIGLSVAIWLIGMITRLAR
ncbi:MAG TPA: DUF2905 domain-containing protein [Trichormus sp. M33_DOE_039]|nr:DUF2905 domain-containing protein [Trichormus sp. M33_DOE_039]